ncbi:hypothetical protein WAJ05_20745, partial [Acinetobacter baumannii]
RDAMATGDKQASPQPVGQPQPGQQSGQTHCCTFLSGDVAERCRWRGADNTDRTICPTAAGDCVTDRFGMVCGTAADELAESPARA